MVFLIAPDDRTMAFPDPHLAEANGLLAIGGDLSPRRLISAYSRGIFPWFSFRDSNLPYWYCPQQRFVIFPRDIHVSHSLRPMLNSERFEITFNRDFDAVISNCSNLRIKEEGAWLGEDMIKAYTELHHMKRAASVEVWEEGNLVGGLYGVTMGHVFAGESMFSLRPGASKLALVHLARRLMMAEGEFLIDCQFETPHLRSMGGTFIDYDEYIRILRG
ncbi:MAG: leucyl/phenylalanyl-tRNA--protein transferase [Muribaculaceae bacterium]|nr:leucyl/phenylalanyl-tRNA--protein transferase [Muribaculaceae bacterium]MDE6804731.1 leucyl/phenylalanyl-tRNA--protein transferase [Muribaculaceae bacterium]MDE6843345.1 leucyl/phenylalanyl-tRNA--protein transferase [Muribaculaceae bacterium]MDE7189289.1 leucyl/phenylalanyl-tRNA--protein transferase [Muribaculaceae bacterium]